MCKHVSELDVETWLTFHAEHLGAERFYLRIDSDYKPCPVLLFEAS